MTTEMFNVFVNEEPSVEGRSPLLLTDQDEAAGFDGSSGASFHGSVFNLSCSIVGSGIISLPAAFKVVGLVPGVILVVLAAFLTESSIEMLLRFSKPGSVSSYGDLMGEAFGRMGSISLQASVVIQNLGCLIVYMIIIEDVLSGSTSSGVHHAGILEQWCGEHWWTGRAFILIVVTLVVFLPLISFKRIDSLRFTSTISIALAVLFLLVVTGITVYKIIMGSVEAPAWFPTVTDLTSFLNLFTAVPVVVVTYVCHYNVHTIENELQDTPKMRAVVQTSLVLCATVYMMTGVFGYLLFGESTMSDFLSNFDSDLDIPYSSLFNDLVRLSYVGHIILVVPILFFPLRINLDGLLFPSAEPVALNNKRFTLISLGLIFISLLGAIYIRSIWVAFEFLGSTVSALVAFIFPASITLKDPHCIATRTDKILSIFMITIASLSSVIAIYSDAYSSIS